MNICMSRSFVFTKNNNRQCPSADSLPSSTIGAVTLLILRKKNLLTSLFLMIMSCGVFGLIGIFGSSAAYATDSTITLTVGDTIAVDALSSESGRFNHNAGTISVTTDHVSGYTLTISASSDSDNGALTNTSTNSTIPTINSTCMGSGNSSITSANFSSRTECNDMWGYSPSYYNSTANSNYLPSPNTTGDVLDITTTANTTAKTYSIDIGTKITGTTTPGSYTKTFIINAIGNQIPYTINYNSGMAAGMPVDVSGSTDASTITLDSATPTAEGYIFLGWCTVVPTRTNNIDACTGGTQYAPGATYSLSNGANLNLYAMWLKPSYMQDQTQTKLAEMMPNVGDEATLVDNRDGKSYTVAHEADGKYWMTQNLDLELTTSGAYNPTTGTSTALTSENTNLTTSGSGIYSDGYTSSGGVITWTPASGATTSSHTISGTTVSSAFSTSSYTIPESAEGGDTYVYTSGTTSDDTVFTSLSDCETTGGHTEAECKHYHVGNYYSWTAAIASNNSTNISTNYDNAANSICPAGWRLPHGRASSDTSSTREFGYLFQQAQITSSLTATSYATGGFNKLRTTPLFFVRGGSVTGSSLNDRASYGFYWSSTVYSSYYAYLARLYSSTINSALSTNRYYGRSVRCVASPQISFTINSVTYQAEEGMTWGQWISSIYNTSEYTSSNLNNSSSQNIALNSDCKSSSSLIQAGGAYVLMSPSNCK